MRKSLISLIATVLFSLPAMAADNTKPYSVPSSQLWNGWYVGLAAGHSFNASTAHPFGDIGGDSWLVGGYLGVNRQYGNWVVGIETDYHFSDLGGTNAFGPITATHAINDFGSLRGRFGYAMGNYLIYGTGGLAYARTEASLSVPGFSTSASQNYLGYTVGGGVEAQTGGVIWRLDYRYWDLGTELNSFPIAGPVAFAIPADITFHTVMLGAAIKF